MKDDTISRAAALDALGEEPPVWYDGEDEIAERNQWRRDVAAIKALPSATDTNVGGNLSVDELITFLNPESNYVFYDDSHGFCINTQDVLDHLCAMPSAQLAQDLPNTCTDAIGRQAAVETVRKAKDKSEAHRMLIQLPSAQKHGMWIVQYFGADAKCSECGMYCVGAYDHDRHDNYCRCCGAKMDGLKLEGEEP